MLGRLGIIRASNQNEESESYYATTLNLTKLDTAKYAP